MTVIRDADDADPVDPAEVQWHIHNDLCFGGEPGAWTLSAHASPPAPCPAGSTRRTMNPTMHVRITPHECGPFASLEGLGAGRIAPGEQRACDLAHGSHGQPEARASSGDVVSRVGGARPAPARPARARR